jgi:hypothetical protein
MRHTVSLVALKNPYLVNASTAYCEQVGVNLHAAGVSGEMHT